MRDYVFFYKNNNTADRDCVKYLDIEDLDTLSCGHYFRGLNICGACYAGDFDKILKDENVLEEMYNNITTILTKEEFKKLAKYNQKIGALGYGLDKNESKQAQGHLYFKDIKSIVDKLTSEDNQKLFERVQEEEKEFLMNNNPYLTSEEVEEIWEHYGLPYRDRSIVVIYNDYEELGKDYARDCLDIPSHLGRYFDYELLGEDLTYSEDYLELSSGRIASLNR